MHLFTPLEDLTSFSDRRAARDFARQMSLRGGVVSSVGEALVSALMEEVVLPHRSTQGQLRPTMVPQYRKALIAIMHDLLVGASTERWSKCSTTATALDKAPGGRRAFAAVRGALGAAGLLEELPGFKQHDIHASLEPRCAVTSFRPTPRLLELAEGLGVTLGTLADHFSYGRSLAPDSGPADIILARAAKPKVAPRKWGEPKVSVTGKDMALDPRDPKASAIRNRLSSLNNHLTQPGRIGKLNFEGLRRIFNNADQPGFNWQWGGRFATFHGCDAYMNRARDVRSGIRIDGEEVVEVDIRAAHLTILHGLLSIPFTTPEDPHALPGYERDGSKEGKAKEEVKTWLRMALGASSESTGGRRWAKVRRAALDHYPVLTGLSGHGISTLDLQYHESEIMMAAMEDLRDLHGIGFLPVHDALMVPKSKVALAQEVLGNAFRRYFLETLGMPIAPEPRFH